MAHAPSAVSSACGSGGKALFGAREENDGAAKRGVMVKASPGTALEVVKGRSPA